MRERQEARKEEMRIKLEKEKQRRQEERIKEKERKKEEQKIAKELMQVPTFLVTSLYFFLASITQFSLSKDMNQGAVKNTLQPPATFPESCFHYLSSRNGPSDGTTSRSRT